jgi:hypothetical protein
MTTVWKSDPEMEWHRRYLVAKRDLLILRQLVEAVARRTVDDWAREQLEVALDDGEDGA